MVARYLENFLRIVGSKSMASFDVAAVPEQVQAYRGRVTGA
jgi:hypothetical protein